MNVVFRPGPPLFWGCTATEAAKRNGILDLRGGISSYLRSENQGADQPLFSLMHAVGSNTRNRWKPSNFEYESLYHKCNLFYLSC